MRKKLAVSVSASALVLAFGVVTAFGIDSDATTHSNPDMSAYSQLVENLTHHHLKVLKTVHTGVPDLTGLITETATGQKGLVFGMDGKYLIAGPVIGENHTILNKTIAEQQGLMPKALPVDTLVNKMIQSKGFVLGHSGPMIAAFLDPNCIFCHLFYEDVKPELKAGKLRIKVIPVGFLKPSSLPKAVHILSSKNPAQAWAYNEKNFNVHAEEGGISPAKNLHTPVTAEIEANTRLLSHTGGVATPTIVYCQKDAKPVLVQGAEPNLLKAIQSGQIGDLLPTGACQG